MTKIQQPGWLDAQGTKSPSVRSTNLQQRSRRTRVMLLLDGSSSMDSINQLAKRAASDYITQISATDPPPQIAVGVFHSGQGVECVREVGSIKFHGMTPLFDAIGNSIEMLEHDDKPGDRTVLAIVTDGEENDSHSYGLLGIKCKIFGKVVQGWHIIFLGANQDAVNVGQDLGVKPQNCLTFNVKLIEAAVKAASRSTTEFLLGATQTGFTEQERRDAVLKLEDKR